MEGGDTRTIAEVVMDILGLQASKVGPKEALANLGIDSMQMVEVRTTVQRMAATPISLAEVGNLTLDALQELQKKVKTGGPGKRAPEAEATAAALVPAKTLPPPPNDILPSVPLAIPADPSQHAVDALLNLGPNAVERAPEVARERAWFPCSFNQEQMVFLHEMDRESSVAFNMSLVLSLQSVISLDALYESTRMIMVQHESLRTIFRKNDDGSIQQSVLDVDEVMPPVKILDVRSLPAPEKEAAKEGLLPASVVNSIRQQAQTPFDVTNGAPPLLFQLVTMSRDHHLMLILIHHSLGDMHSMMLMSKSLKDAYVAASTKQLLPPPPPKQYVAYSTWQREQWNQQKMAGQLAYWKAKLQGAPALLELPTDRIRPAVASYKGGRVMLRFPPQLAADVRELAKLCGTTVFQVMLTAYKVRMFP